MTEDTSCFENFIKEMNSSQNSIEKVKKLKCENANCKSVFANLENCKSCNKKFCKNCLNNCENCGIVMCVFCTRVDYGKFKDVQICPNC
jgi:hypothetical protein